MRILPTYISYTDVPVVAYGSILVKPYAVVYTALFTRERLVVNVSLRV